ncbi:VCBS repeat-containing protein [Akkermansiaceae bacterium]|nr:VCBS repeat-containing protein [Akkermansiaceae bacterium]
MDGDGDIDVLAAKPGSPFGGGSIVIYRNNGNGSFMELNNRFPGSSAALVSNVVGSDLDNDGDIDVVVGSSGFSSGGVRVYRNNGNLSFTRTFDNGNAPGLWDIHLVDLNRDNRPEIIFSLGGSFDQIGIYINSGNLSSWGSLISAKTGTNTGDEPRSLHAADIDGDGDLDVILASPGDNKIAWYEQLGGGAKDSDGVNDDEDAFFNDLKETADTDNDGVGDNADVFPNDPTEIADCDNDGVGDNADARSPQIIAGLEAQIAQLQAQITELSKRPTLEQIQDARLNSIVMSAGQNNTATLKFSIEESADLKTWTKQGKSVEAGFPLEAGKKFLRFSLEKE